MTSNLKSKILIVVTFLAAIWAFNSPLVRTEAAIEKAIIKSIPMGTSIDGVKQYITKKNWQFDDERRGVRSNTDERNYPYVRGSSFIIVVIGRYLGGYAYVEAFFGFDDADKLIDIKIRKTYE